MVGGGQINLAPFFPQLPRPCSFGGGARAPGPKANLSGGGLASWSVSDSVDNNS
jgi:hypothetical protein